MHGIVELILTSASLWMLLQVIWSSLISVFYHFCIPWIVWGTFVTAIGLKIARIPPPNLNIVQEVLGINPILLKRDSIMSKTHDNEEQHCMRVVAHRGGGYDFPENSLTAFRNCKDRGCNAVELDVLLTKDNVPIVFHDTTIDRVTGQPGTIKDMTWDQLKDLDITHNHPLKDKFTDGEKIPLLSEVLETCLSNEQRIIIDIKEKRLEVVEAILDAYKKYPKLFQRAVVSSFNPIIIYMLRRKEPRIVSSLAWRPQYFSRVTYLGLDGPAPARYNNPFKHIAASVFDYIYDWMLNHFIYYVVGVSAILLHKDIVNQRVIQVWHDRNVRVMAWTVNLPSEKSHFSRLFKITYITDTLLVEKDM
ncbi:glycerophosphodiester phosphodiesterase 1 [Osmia lignaria lignaria]|uniref:glycerophosphodiester phosphodiesterase 1 n=1 Tax=Osmia lignaria lignaria TaxID=1437193 RepID=UPI001478741E|nr:glycerophosphodiester phosphodiesterase 1 [Osmia lignaria]XP_034185794.1 glycerophosphodiester phosphodiesterase 1 [Osmia lignaria]XP_034185795.1 glycerophosphodiester phosphodiesterase 1 [Osmia lignaria]